MHENGCRCSTRTFAWRALCAAVIPATRKNCPGEKVIPCLRLLGRASQDRRARPMDDRASSSGVADITVELEDSNGNVIATTTTDREGNSSFDQQNGVSGTGEYTVGFVIPSGFTHVSPNPSTILISRGDISVRGVNFAIIKAN